jgi:hypothetical protein
MNDINTEFAFLKKYKEKKLISIQAIPQWPEGFKHVSDEVVLSFDDNSQLVFNSNFEDVDLFFFKDEDVVFKITEQQNHEAFSNLGDSKMTSILVNEMPVAMSLVYDEISLEETSTSNKVSQYPIGLFINTNTRKICICRELLDATWLNAEFSNADISMLYSMDEMWGDFEDVSPFIVKRKKWDAFSNETTEIETKHYNN